LTAPARTPLAGELKAGQPEGFAKSMKDHFVGIHTRLGD
jgi:hypothetical protein